MKSKLKLSVVLVNYNSGHFLTDCVKSLQNQGIDLDIYVVDNASSDNSLNECQEMFNKIKVIQNKKNIGFGAACNKGARKANTEYILFLNPDTKIEEGTLKFMIDFMDHHPDVGAASCKAIKGDGSLDWAYHRGFPTPWASLLYFLGNDSLYHLTDRNMDQPHEVDAISGSFFLTRESVLEKVGLFDEDYWMYGEDLDLSFRIKKAGFKIMYVPDVKIIHLKGISSGIKEHSQKISTADQASKLRSFNAFYETMKIFYRKNLEKSYPFFINWLVYLAIDFKWFSAKRKMQV